MLQLTLLAVVGIKMVLLGPMVDGRASPYKISLLQIVPFTGSEPRNAKTCRAASQIVADLANNRTDILPDYSVEIDFEDEGAGGQKTVKAVAAYARNFEEGGNNDETTYQSPIILGPHISGGCKALGGFVHHFNSIEVSTFCAGPCLVNRKLYPNLYLMISTGQVTAIAMNKFIKVIGQWKKIAVLSNANNINDYTTALKVQQIATENGIAVPVLDIVLDITADTISSMKVHDLRIIVTLISGSGIGLIPKLFCETYKQGMTGPKYVFIINISAFLDPRVAYPEVIYPSCTRAMVLEQMRYTIYVGQASAPWEGAQFRSELGLSIAEFEAMLDRYMNGPRVADYDLRYICHDATLRAIFVLDSIEKKLKKDYNLTLRNFRDYPELVVKVANQSVLESRLGGLRIGKIFYGKETGQVDNDVQTINYFLPEIGGVDLRFMVNLMANATGASFGSYSITKIRPLVWLSKDGTLPKDRKIIQNVVSEVSEEAFIVVTVVSGVISAIQLAFLVATVFSIAKGVAGIHFPLSKVIGFVGSIVLNAARDRSQANMFSEEHTETENSISLSSSST